MLIKSIDIYNKINKIKCFISADKYSAFVRGATMYILPAGGGGMYKIS